MTPLIEFRSVTRSFGGGLLERDRVIALDNFSLTIDDARPSITAIVGESGSGKTTLARLLLGFTAPSSGSVLYRGSALHDLSRRERREFRREVQAIFQDPYGVYNPFYRVDHVLTTPVARFGLASSRDEARELIGDALRTVGLRPEEILGRFPHQLSGGQRQRVMVARALLLRPRLIVADEPVSMVDASLRATILASLQQLHRERGISIIYITHDLATAYQVADNIVVLYRARVAEVGDVELVVKSPLHPYTRLLIASIPRVTTERDWPEEESRSAPAADSGCRFASRCPVAMPECAAAPPPMFRTERNRATACYQYRDHDVLAADALHSVMAGPGPAIHDLLER
jgi:oligopeptide/dipeptide ABC transporter ATP-binding protein